ncbi:TMEM270 isoform 2 [Pongo abelii]|uniref:TMEM270 isoform 2 n=1 Tax=Pongo abelii TaxID=9601 RepID=A0A2J8XUU7_PONAB|nr:TMEM270 isoform 2 [Pongo abelii]
MEALPPVRSSLLGILLQVMRLSVLRQGLAQLPSLERRGAGSAHCSLQLPVSSNPPRSASK